MMQSMLRRSVVVQAVASPHKQQCVRAPARQSTQAKRASVKRNRRPRYILSESEADMQNSFYMPSSTWDNLLVVEDNKTVGCSKMGPTCTDKYDL